MVSTDTIGLIAGNRALPLLFARLAKKAGVKRLVAVAFENETDPALAPLVDDITWIRVGQLSRLISAFQDRGVAQCVMLGQIAPRNLFELRPDLRGMRLLLRIKEKNAHTIFGAIADELKSEGIQLVEPTSWLRPVLAGPAFHIGKRLSTALLQDVDFGYRKAKEIARLEIGQTVVVKDGVVLAVEGFEGTDQCLVRGGALAGKGGGAVAVKVAKERHDMRFDVPCIGRQTIETCAAAGVQVLAIEQDKSLVLDQDWIASFVPKHGMSITAVPTAV